MGHTAFLLVLLCHLQVSRDGEQFVAFCADGRVRVWRFATGKLRRTYDESLEVRGLEV